MIRYEWVIETVDAYGDIQSVWHNDKFKEAAATAAFLKADGEQRVEVGLVRDDINDYDENLEDRQWAYLEDGVLPAKFDGGAKVPKRYLAEVAKAQEVKQ
jgi:hypothetical protein